MMLLASICSAQGQTNYSYRYWFDADIATAQTGEASGEATLDIDISTLKKGSVHALHLQGMDERGKWSTVRTTSFYVAESVDTAAATARYWFDSNETEARTSSTISGTIELDIAKLDCGIHAVHFQSFSNGGVASPVKTTYFYKKEGEDLSVLSCRLWIDDDIRAAQTFDLSGSNIVMEAADLSIGQHDLHVVLLSASGQMVAQTTTPFTVFDPDGITLVEAFTDDDVFYDVAGRRLPKMQKGIVIKGGKKILVK